MTHSVDASPLGQKTAYISSYDAGLLYPIARSESRKVLGISADLPFYGCDIWTGYELSWLNSKGKPVVAVAEFKIPCDSPCIIESKSFKLYLNSFNQTRFSGLDDVKNTLLKDLSAVAGNEVNVDIRNLSDSKLLVDVTYEALCLDGLDIDVDAYHPDPELLTVDASENVAESLCSHLLKSNCPVTGQPDWASLFIEYSGAKINHENLLRYVISFREHQDFHEHCVERIFVDVMRHCKPTSLSVYARYTRRGGLDINPFRANYPVEMLNSELKVGRLLRQ
jgi:7-cyano-7-deazaguanine reductase